MKQLLGSTSVILVIFLFALGFWLYDRRKKKKEILDTNIQKLKQKKVHRVEILDASWSDKNLAIIKDWTSMNNGRIVELEDLNFAVYFGESGNSQFKGFLNIPIVDLPVRLVFMNRTGSIELRQDEDFGFQKFFGKVKREFNSRYSSRFENNINELNNLLRK